MSVVARFALAAGVLILLLTAAMAYHLRLLGRLAEGQKEFADAHFEAIDQARDLDRIALEIDLTARRLMVREDPDYAVRLLDLDTELEQRLTTLGELELPDGLREAVTALQEQWLQVSMFDLWASPDPPRGASLGRLLEWVSGMRQAAEGVVTAARDSMVSETGRVERRQAEAQSISWAVVGIALLLGLITFALMIRSVRSGMHALADGTRTVAEGDFSHRIDAGEGELGQIGEAFNRMTARLNDLEKLKTELLSRVSHELRTPLVAMHETNQLLIEELPGPLTAKQRRLLEINVEGGRRLAGMIGKLLDVSSLEAGATRFDRAPHDLTELVRRAAAAFEGQARERGVGLRVDRLPAGAVICPCDGERVLQVIENLLDNAIKHSPAGRTVRVRLDHRPTPPPELPRRWQATAELGPAGVAVVSVLDRGPGVPDDQKERIFDKFHRLASGRRDGSADGVGLGLAICQEIAMAHDGAIWVEDRGGVDTEDPAAGPRGSEFRFLIGAESATGRPAVAQGVA